ncbi:MAG: hypothetical protein HKO57_02290 [Akkermansiaceae bacterium]|nr:hypothetical protein [Akkermansiaceae bacterium]
MNASDLSRRHFLRGSLGAGMAGLAPRAIADSPLARPAYGGPNVIIVRYGGGVRRRETIDDRHTYAPYLCKELTKRGTLFKNMMIEQLEGVETSHGQGTLYILTGKYDRFKDYDNQFLGERFEARVPTVFEYLRKTYNVANHETLIVNGEDRTQEEFYSFSNHHLFGANFKSETLSLFRYKAWLLGEQLAAGKWTGKKLKEKQKQLRQMESIDYRTGGKLNANPQIREFWAKWKRHYGESGFVNPRGDRLLTELTLWSMQLLKPRLVMVNYNDPDYVHWGNMSHYTRGVAIIDQGIKQLVSAVDADPFYRDNTIFVVVPDCGRDSNPLVAVPCQHHFNSKSSHEIWSLIFGPGVPENTVVDREVQQVSLAATIGRYMDMPTKFTEGPVLEEAIA